MVSFTYSYWTIQIFETFKALNVEASIHQPIMLDNG